MGHLPGQPRIRARRSATGLTGEFCCEAIHAFAARSKTCRPTMRSMNSSCRRSVERTIWLRWLKAIRESPGVSGPSTKRLESSY